MPITRSLVTRILKAETSHSFTGSLNWENNKQERSDYTSVLSGFYNDVKNLIDYAVSASDPNVFMLTNVSNSKTAGVSLITTARRKQWNLSAGFSYTGFYNDYSETDKSLPALQWSPEVNSTIGYTFSKIDLNVNLFYKFTGKRPYYAVNTNQELVLTEQEAITWLILPLIKKHLNISHFLQVSETCLMWTGSTVP